MALKLYTYPGNWRAFQALIAAKYNGIDVELPSFHMGTDNKKPEFLVKSPMGKVPVLETPEGCIWEAFAIAQYVARMRADSNMYGTSFFESAQVDQWLEFAKNEIDIAMGVWVYPVLGFINYNKSTCEKAKNDIKKVLEVLNAHLLTATFLVGNGVTLADVVIVCSLLNGFKLVFDPTFLSPYPNVVRWFTTCVNQPQFLAVLGETKLCEKPMEAAGSKSESEKKTQPEAKNDGKKSKQDKKQDKKEGKTAAPALDKEAEKKLKKVIKEGGKKGVEIEGASVMAGLEFFTTQLDEPDGDMAMLVEGMKAMNAEPDPNNDEERKGGAGGVGKIVFSAGSTELLMVCNVPGKQLSKVDQKEWLTHVASSVGGTLDKTIPAASPAEKENTGDLMTAVAKGNADKGEFPIKMKDVALSASIAFLRSKGAFPDDDDDDDDMVFGDDCDLDDFE